MADDHPRWRNRDGRFASTWQPRFREHTSAFKFELVPIDVWRTILSEANEPVVVAMEGRRRMRVTRLEAALLELGCSATARVRQLKSFIKAVRAAAYYVEMADALERVPALDREAQRQMASALHDNDESLWRYIVHRYQVRVIAEQPHDFTLQLASQVYPDGVPAGDRTFS
jgi:hypothetical protein